jgi:hypothetical protein
VDYIRTAAGTLEQLREHQFRRMDNTELLCTLATDRVRRTIALCLEVVADLDAGRLKNASEDVGELYQNLGHVHEHLRTRSSVHAAERDFRQRKVTASIHN